MGKVLSLLVWHMVIGPLSQDEQFLETNMRPRMRLRKERDFKQRILFQQQKSTAETSKNGSHVK
jgi:hypothetical protein